MQKGYNSDILVKGKMFHVQTEDWGVQNPFVVSRIFLNGAVVKTIKTPYSQIVANGPSNAEDSIRIALKKQHTVVVDDLVTGKNY